MMNYERITFFNRLSTKKAQKSLCIYRMTTLLLQQLKTTLNRQYSHVQNVILIFSQRAQVRFEIYSCNIMHTHIASVGKWLERLSWKQMYRVRVSTEVWMSFDINIVTAVSNCNVIANNSSRFPNWLYVSVLTAIIIVNRNELPIWDPYATHLSPI